MAVLGAGFITIKGTDFSETVGPKELSPGPAGCSRGVGAAPKRDPHRSPRVAGWVSGRAF